MFIKSIIKRASDHGNSELTRINYLDGWRGIAIILVLLEHFFHVRQVNVGRMGVDIFFVLSGMLMSNILFIKRVPLSTFYKRRISRIFPVFFIFITSVSLFSLLFDLSKEHNNYLYNLLFIRAYYPETPDLWNTGIPIGHLWSLNVEEHSYVLLSILTLITVLRGRLYIPLFILGFGAILLQYTYVRYPDIAPPNYYLRSEIVASFLMISAGYFLIKSKFEHLIPSWAPLVSLSLAFLCYSPYSPHWSAQWTLSPFLLAFTVNHLNLAPVFFKSALSFWPIRLIGLWSFSIYLWQQPLYYYGSKSGDIFNYSGPILFFISILFGVISFYLIENPTRRYLNNRW